MDIHSKVVDGPAFPAATVVMLRDAAEGLQVFMVRRHAASSVLGGAHVFPGGKLDDDDARLDAAGHLDQPAQTLQAALAEPETDAAAAAALYVAALREAFEECGVLYAQARDGGAVDTAGAATLLAQGRSFADMLGELGLQLHTRELVPWSRWITPRVPSISSRRFDTRFFVAAIPPGQTARHDDVEATDSAWLTPRAALAMFLEGSVEMAPPQIMSLAHLARHADVASVLREARLRPPPVIQPEPFDEDGARVICYPGDPRHPIRARALPGPTRLRFRHKRFEPMDGFGELLP